MKVQGSSDFNKKVQQRRRHDRSSIPAAVDLCSFYKISETKKESKLGREPLNEKTYQENDQYIPWLRFNFEQLCL